MTPIPTGREGEYATPGQCCPWCEYQFEIAVTLGAKPPTAGTVTVCMRCGQPSIYDRELNLAKVTAEMMTLFKFTMPDLFRQIQSARDIVRLRRHESGHA